MKILELKYSNTNTYLIEADGGYVLFDTGWAGTFPAFRKAMGELKVAVQDIRYVLISHFHPDHMGIAQQIADEGAVIVVFDVQKDHIHSADKIFEKEGNRDFKPLDDAGIKIVPIARSREFLASAGLAGKVLHTPGHSDDSISLCLDDGAVFVGDLNPLYELELHKGTVIGKSWEMILSMKPSCVYYGHAPKAVLKASGKTSAQAKNLPTDKDLYRLTGRIMKYIDRGMPLEKIARKTGADPVFVQDVARMYLTHQNVGVQGILDRIEIKGK